MWVSVSPDEIVVTGVRARPWRIRAAAGLHIDLFDISLVAAVVDPPSARGGSAARAALSGGGAAVSLGAVSCAARWGPGPGCTPHEAQAGGRRALTHSGGSGGGRRAGSGRAPSRCALRPLSFGNVCVYV